MLWPQAGQSAFLRPPRHPLPLTRTWSAPLRQRRLASLCGRGVSAALPAWNPPPKHTAATARRVQLPSCREARVLFSRLFMVGNLGLRGRRGGGAWGVALDPGGQRLLKTQPEAPQCSALCRGAFSSVCPHECTRRTCAFPS